MVIMVEKMDNGESGIGWMNLMRFGWRVVGRAEVVDIVATEKISESERRYRLRDSFQWNVQN